MAEGGNGSDEFVNFKCCLCVKKNITREADTYCVECQDYYCTSCTDLHKMFPSSVGVHQFIDKSSFNTSSLQKMLPSFPVEKCAAHKSKVIDMYCADHDEVACVTCIAIKHRTCQNIHSVPDEVDSLYKKIDVDKTNRKMLQIKTKLEDVEKTKKLQLNELDAQRQKAVESIRHFRREMEAKMDSLEKATINNLEEKYENVKQKLEMDIKRIQKHIDELKLSSQKLTQSGENKAQEFVTVKISKQQVIEANDAEGSMKNLLDIKVEFIADSKMKDVFKDLTSFGSVSVHETGHFRDKIYDVKSKKQVNIKTPYDKRTCSVFGSCITDKGLLFLADCKNKALKLVDMSSESITDQLYLNACPLSICQINKYEFAVSLENNTIQFVSIVDKLQTTTQLKLDHFCYGLAFKDNKLFISDNCTSLYIYDIIGTMIHKVTNDKQGNAIFKCNRHISVSSDDKMIYVADYHNGVKVLDLEGNYKTTIVDPDFVDTIGVCTDKRGNIFVSGSGLSKIVQLNEKSCLKLGILGDVQNSASLCFDPKHNKLFVTFWNRDTIEEYVLA